MCARQLANITSSFVVKDFLPITILPFWHMASFAVLKLAERILTAATQIRLRPWLRTWRQTSAAPD